MKHTTSHARRWIARSSAIFLIMALAVNIHTTYADDNAQQAQMVKDINLATKGAFSYCGQDSCDEPYSNGYIARVGDKIFFTADDGVHGEELWVSDGISTTLVADIKPGADSSYPQDMTDVNGVIFFSADDGETGYELYKYDGSSVSRVKDLKPGPDSSNLGNFINVNGTLYFSADDGSNGQELWRSDGTEDGTELVADINPGGRSGPGWLTLVGNTLFFTANNGTSGDELWKYDTSTETATLVKDIKPGSGTSRPYGLVAAGDKVFFNATGDNSGQELWVSDGTAGGTYLVQDLDPRDNGSGYYYGSNPFDLVAVGEYVYFPATHPDYGRELFRSDGTPDDTELVTDIVEGIEGSDPRSLTNLNGIIFFTADDGTSGYELWKHDTGTGTTAIVKDIYPGESGSSVEQLTRVGNRLFFRAKDGTNGEELWVTDGTTTTMLEIHPSDDSEPNFMVEGPGGNLFFRADDGYHGHELWVSDGTAEGTSLVEDIMTTPLGSDPWPLLESNGTLFVSASDTTHGSELWVTDGTEAGTALLEDINPAVYGSSYPNNMVELNGRFFFAADDGTHGQELWVTDGTSGGAQLFLDIYPDKDEWGNINSSAPRDLIMVGDKLFFSADNGTNGRELWITDGTVEGTQLLKDVYEGEWDSTFNDLTVFDGRLFWRATDGVHGDELWVSDGTPEGTHLFKDIQVGESWASGTPMPIAVAGGKLLFGANDGINGDELWVSDGTITGTQMLKDIYSGTHPNYGYSFSSNPENFAVLGDKLVFTADDGSHGKELWISDGTEDGTLLLKDIYEGEGCCGSPASSQATNLTASSGKVFFSANDGINGTELWITDGTITGTQLLKDIAPGEDNWGNIQSSYPSWLTSVNGTLYFSANDSTHGTELWMSDGTPEGTVLVADVNPNGGSNPQNMAAVNQRLVFEATGSSGDDNELWFIYLPVDATDDSYDTGTLPTLTVTAAEGVLANDAGSSDATASLANPPANGTLALSVDGSFVYTPTAGYAGTDTFTYVLGNGGPYTDTAAVTLTVQAVYDPVDAVDDSYETDQDTMFTVSAAEGVLANDTGGSEPTVTLDTVPANGTVDLAVDGSFVYTPASGYTGTDTFTYVLGNDGPYTDTAAVTITVHPNDGPSSGCVAQGSGNWKDVFPDCLPGEKRVIPAGVTVVLDADIELDGDLQVEGTLDPNGHTVTLTGDEDQTLTGNPLTFYRLVVNKDDRRDKVFIDGKLEVTDKLTITRGRLRSASDYHDIEIGPDGTLELASDITVSGNWTNNGTFVANTHRVTFDGSTPQTITGAQSSLFYGLMIGDAVQVFIATTPGVTDTIVNNGVLSQTQTLNGSAGSPAGFNFLRMSADKYQGVDITTEENLGEVSVAIWGNADQCTGTPPEFNFRNRCFRITSANGGSADMTFYTTPTEDDVAGSDKLYQYVSGNWTEVTDSETPCGSNAGAGCTTGVTGSLVAGDNHFLIGSGEDPVRWMYYFPLVFFEGSGSAVSQ